MEQRPELVLTPRRGRADRWVQAETDAGEQSSAGRACVHPDLGSPLSVISPHLKYRGVINVSHHALYMEVPTSFLVFCSVDTVGEC